MWRIIIAICSILLGTTEARPKYTSSSRSYTKRTTYSPSTYSGYRGGYGGSYTNVYVGGGGYYYMPAYYGYHSTVVVGGGGGGGLCVLLCILIFIVFLLSATGNFDQRDEDYHEYNDGFRVEEEVVTINEANFSYPMGCGPGIAPLPVPPPQTLQPGMYVPQPYCHSGHVMQWFNYVPPTYPGALGVTCEVCQKDIPVEFWFVHCPMCQVDLCQPCAN